MVWHIYEWLWPLFAICTKPQPVSLEVSTPLFITTTGNRLATLTYTLCPTPLMHLLVGLAAVGLLSLLLVCAYGFFKLVHQATRPPAAAHALRTMLYQLDQAQNTLLTQMRKGGEN